MSAMLLEPDHASQILIYWQQDQYCGVHVLEMEQDGFCSYLFWPLFKEIKDICFCLQAGIRASKQLQFSQNFALPKKQFVSYSSETEHSFLSTLLCAYYILLLCLHKTFLLKHGIFGRIGKANIFRWHHCLCLALRETGRTQSLSHSLLGQSSYQECV